MAIELTQQQREALECEGWDSRRVIDPLTHASYVLVPESEYEAIRELLEEERRERAIHEIGLRSVGERLTEEP